MQSKKAPYPRPLHRRTDQSDLGRRHPRVEGEAVIGRCWSPDPILPGRGVRRHIRGVPTDQAWKVREAWRQHPRCISSPGQGRSSRLGWRILLTCEAFTGCNDVLRQVAAEEVELVDLVPDEYRERHLALARSVVRWLEGEELMMSTSRRSRPRSACPSERSSTRSSSQRQTTAATTMIRRSQTRETSRRSFARA